ncbi:MAG: hypothetical protein ACRDY3_00935 [Acidimicrobiales bacterium]
MVLNAYVDVVPWIVFVVVDRHSGMGPGWAALSAAACGCGIAGWSRWRARPSLLGVVAVTVFGSVAVVVVLDDQTSQWFEPALRAACVLALAVTAFWSLSARSHHPLSQPYTADRVPPGHGSDPAFARVNRRITAIWGAAVSLVALSFGCVALGPSDFTLTLLDWVVPIVVIGAAVRWVAIEWSGYQVVAEGTGPGAATLADTAPRGVGYPPPVPDVTYLPGVRPGP